MAATLLNRRVVNTGGGEQDRPREVSSSADDGSTYYGLSSHFRTCCRRARGSGAARRARAAGMCLQTLRTAVSAVGAAGGGWAILAILRSFRESLRPVVEKQINLSEEVTLSSGVVPRHIAVIMDGNRRYGRLVHGESLSGHKAGGEKLSDFVEWCSEAGIEYLTVFAFSTENWKRDSAEVDGMMRLFLQEVPRLGEKTRKLNVRVTFLVSDGELLPRDVREATEKLERDTADASGLCLQVCLSYGGRSDVVRACKSMVQEVAGGSLAADDIDEEALSRRLLTGQSPDPDVLIRTSGERRLSNFLMYQLAYAEMFFFDKHWPEITKDDLWDVILSYRQRNRRFGK